MWRKRSLRHPDLFFKLYFAVLRSYLQCLEFFSPRYAASQAYGLMSRPRRVRIKDFEQAALDRAATSDMEFKGYTVKIYRWGVGDPRVLLVHGWEGNAGNFGALVDLLVAHGCSVLAFDAPAHGQSSGTVSSMFDFGEFVATLLQATRVDHVITHSFGTVATVFALSTNPDLVVDKLVLLTAPDRFEDRIDQFLGFVGLSARTKQPLMDIFEQETGYKVSDLSVSQACKAVRAKNVLILHDRADRVLPIAWSRRVVDQWPQARLVELTGTGHYRILRDAQTAEVVRGFLFGES